MVENSYVENLRDMLQRFMKRNVWFRNNFLQYILPILGGIIIGIISAFIMRFLKL